MKIAVTPIGIIHSPFKEAEGVPIQPVFANGAAGTVEIYPEYSAGLADLDGFSHIILLYWLHKSSGYSLTCRPFLDTQERGIFATRAPRRPNPLGFSIVELLKVESRFLTVGSIDIIDQTPLLDIKPYVPDFDVREQVRTGWYEKAQNKSQTIADKRFTS
jgi:tRNA (adenine37-N6)-methyltransferase